MRRHRVAALGIGAIISLAPVAGCASLNSTLDLIGSTADAVQTVSDAMPHKSIPPATAFNAPVEQSGTAATQAVEMHPYVRAEFISLSGGMRRLRADFRVDQDAYVLIGHIDAAGVVRIVFPATPGDNGFLQANRSYQSPEFVGGFTDDYRYRAQTSRYNNGFQPESYDGNVGYMFIVASAQPMNYGSLISPTGGWDSFELVNPDQISDPRPAVRELAQSIAPNAVVSFAHAYDTIYSQLADASPYPYGTPGYADCAFSPAYYNTGYSVGFGSYFGSRSLALNARYGYGYPSYPYGYGYGYGSFDGYSNCSGSPYGYAYGYPYGSPFVFVGFPVPVPVPVVPIGPTPQTRRFDPGYRRPGQPQPQPRVNAHFAAGPPNVDPAVQNAPTLHARNAPGSSPTPVPSTHFEQPGASSPAPQPEQPRVRAHIEQPQVEQPHVAQPRVEQPHIEQPRTPMPRPENPHVEQPRAVTPPPRMETPRIESPRPSAPPPHFEAPRPAPSSPPASSSSSSGSKPPGKAH